MEGQGRLESQCILLPKTNFMRSLNAYLNSQKIGTLSEGDGLWGFEYDAQWAQLPTSFDLAPGLSRAQLKHVDGASVRAVQWYFDNLLPEGALRETVSNEAKLSGDDAFALLEYLGAESAGSLVLLPPDADVSPASGLQSLSDETLSQRIKNLPRQSLSANAPKRMSSAGAQNKLLVILQNKELFEPVGSTPSTHILKPDHTSADYPSTVINEYVCHKLAKKLGLGPPAVQRRYVPEPVYLIERFDRFLDIDQHIQRLHIIDACQLLNKPGIFKDKAATLSTLAQCIAACRNKASVRVRLYRWLMFNILIGNNDNHLKNISFIVSAQGIDLAPPYDLLSTSVYLTTAYADSRASWPAVELMIPVPGASYFGDVTRAAVISVGAALGLSRRICERELDSMVAKLPGQLAALIAEVEQQNAQMPAATHVFLGGEMRVLRSIQSIVVAEMLKRVAFETQIA